MVSYANDLTKAENKGFWMNLTTYERHEAIDDIITSLDQSALNAILYNYDYSSNFVVHL